MVDKIQNMVGFGLKLTFFAVLPLLAWHLHEEYVIRSAGHHVVMLVNERGEGGTGFHFIAPSGDSYIMTNNHVCGDNDYMKVPGKGKAVLVKKYKKHDLCVMKPLFPHLGGLKFAHTYYKGENARVLGHGFLLPLHMSLGRLEKRVFIWVPSGIGRECKESEIEYPSLFGMVCLRQFDAIFTSITVDPGNSGSPVVDIFGNVVGVVFAGHSRARLGYIVPVEYVIDFIRKM